MALSFRAGRLWNISARAEMERGWMVSRYFVYINDDNNARASGRKCVRTPWDVVGVAGSSIDLTPLEWSRLIWACPFLPDPVRVKALAASRDLHTPPPPMLHNKPGKTFSAAINFSCALRRWRKSGELLSFSPRLISPAHAKLTHWNKIAKRFCCIQHSMFYWGIKQLSVKGKEWERC